MPAKDRNGTIAGRYELESQLGSGGMGSVWKATDLLLDRPVAVKLVKDEHASDPTFAERFRREARSAARLTHSNIVAIHDTGETSDGIPFIVMEYVDGHTLHEVIQRDGPLPVDDVVRIAHSILAALEHAHSRGLVHRDIKPANILVDQRAGVVKIVDLGIAKNIDDAGVTNTSSLIGTASYMSPEQLSGKNATAESDLYAVGCLLYCCLTGKPPFSGENAVTVAMHHMQDPPPPVRSKRPDVPAGLETVVMQALEKEPSRRFASALAMERALGDVEFGVDQETQFWTRPPDVEHIRVLLVDDHLMITQMLALLIGDEPDIDVVGSAATAHAAKAMAQSLEPDVILMDYELPDGDGVSTAHDILAEHPHAKIVMLTAESDEEVLVAAIDAGCTGFVPKDQAVEQVIAAIRSAHAGQAPISPELLARLLPRLRHGGAADEPSGRQP